jgi:uncharacterized protein
MSRDELRQPLKKRSMGERLWARRPSLLSATSFLAAAGFVGLGVWAVATPYPFAGEPIVIAAIPAVEEIKTATTEEVASAELETPAAEEAVEAKDEAPLQSEVYQTEVGIEVAPRQRLRPAPMADLIETSSLGNLPRIGPGNRKPSEVYARLTPMAVLHSERPKIAILLGGMGLNPKLTQRATRDLPGDVTFAFAPYGDNLQEQVNKARSNGHEVLLQLPMEPMGFPANNPGPKTLLSDADDVANLEALHWHMSRFAGYTGITNYMGGKLLNSPKALKPVMQELKKRGLIYLEDASTAVTVSEDVAQKANVPHRSSEIVIDSVATPEGIATALELLEAEAKSNGFAVGTGSGLEVTQEAVKEWAKSLREKGIILVPVSALYKGRLG